MSKEKHHHHEEHKHEEHENVQNAVAQENEKKENAEVKEEKNLSAEEKIAELGLTNRSFYVYILPFDDAEDDKKSIMKNVMREGENDA